MLKFRQGLMLAFLLQQPCAITDQVHQQLRTCPLPVRVQNSGRPSKALSGAADCMQAAQSLLLHTVWVQAHIADGLHCSLQAPPASLSLLNCRTDDRAVLLELVCKGAAVHLSCSGAYIRQFISLSQDNTHRIVMHQ